MSTPGLRVSNVILRVSDMPASLEFYRDRVGLAVRFANAEFAFLDGGTVAVVLNQPAQGMDAGNAGLCSLTEVVLEVPEIASTYETLKTRGVPFRIAPRVVTSDGQRDLMAADFRDPDGHLLSLTGWVPKAAG